MAVTASAPRKRPKPGERRVQILQALATMLEQPGAERITTAALAARLDVSEAALYRHFASKAQMFEGLIEFIEQTVFTLINQIVERENTLESVDGTPDAGAGTRQAIKVVSMLMQFAERNPGMTRVMVGMSLDRMLPAWFSKVSPRFRSPANAHLIYFLLGCVAIYGYNYWTSWYKMTLGVTFACGYVFVISCLAAALLPYRAKALYEASPGAKYTLGGFPLVTVFGVIGFVFGLAAEIAFLAHAGYGLKGTTPYIVVGAIFVVCLVFYWIGRQYNKGKGIDVNYAFLEVPPE